LFTVTGQPLRCDVIVDEIVKVEIETTTKELFLDDSPEEFVLRAVNDKGIFCQCCQYIIELHTLQYSAPLYNRRRR